MQTNLNNTNVNFKANNLINRAYIITKTIENTVTYISD